MTQLCCLNYLLFTREKNAIFIIIEELVGKQNPDGTGVGTTTIYCPSYSVSSVDGD